LHITQGERKEKAWKKAYSTLYTAFTTMFTRGAGGEDEMREELLLFQ